MSGVHFGNHHGYHCVLVGIISIYTVINTASVVRGCRGRNRIVVGFTTTCAISAYHHWCCELESRLERGLQHYVIKFASDLKQVGGFLRVLLFPPPIKLTATIYQKYC